jgi:hypothetical protein
MGLFHQKIQHRQVMKRFRGGKSAGEGDIGLVLYGMKVWIHHQIDSFQ